MGPKFPAVTRRRLVAIGLTAIALAAGAAVLGARLAPDPPAQTTTADGDLVRFRDAPTGLSLSYPATWRRVASADPEVRLIAGAAPTSSLLMRKVNTGVSVDRRNLDDAKRLTDGLLLKTNRLMQLRPPRRIDDLGGLPGWLYIYTFADRATRQRGANAHYFLFKGKTMVTLVFQTIPAERFATSAQLFDRLAATFRVDAPDETDPGPDA